MTLLSEHLCPYLTSEVINCCKAVNIRTVLDFLSWDTEILSHEISVPYKIITSIHCILLACHSSSLQSADNVYDELLSSMSILNTGQNSLNEFLDGGIYTNEITEIHGFPGAGKTQLCLNLVSNIILETGNTAVYIDTNCSFVSRRLVEFFQFETHNRKKMKNALSKVQVMNIHDIFGLFDAIYYIKERLQHEDQQFFSCLRMIVIDSITALLAPCIGNLQSDGMGMMMNIAQQLKALCSELNLAMMITNNAVHVEDAVIKPAMGRYWKHIPSVILCINVENNENGVSQFRKISLVKSCRKSIAGEVVMQFVDGKLNITDETQCN